MMRDLGVEVVERFGLGISMVWWGFEGAVVLIDVVVGVLGGLEWSCFIWQWGGLLTFWKMCWLKCDFCARKRRSSYIGMLMNVTRDFVMIRVGCLTEI